jgi:uncharacterized protein (DUF2267 family)
VTATAAASFAALLACAALTPPATVQAQTAPTAADSAAITRAALDYIEGWYAGDAARMERALHPELAKRMVYRPAKAGARPQLDQQSAMTLVQGTRAGGGKDTPKDKQQKDVAILDIYRNAASAKIVASGWIDYLHLVRSEGGWQIINVLWELKPEK